MGRPTKFDEPAAASIRVRVTPDQRRALQQVAADNRLTVADTIREAVNVFVADYSEASVFRGPQRRVGR